MEINVITLTAAQYAALSAEQIDKVRSAQEKKNELLAKCAEEKRRLKYKLTKNGAIRSCIYDSLSASLTSEYNAKIDSVREGLLFYLQYSAKPETEGGTSASYADYSLSPTARVQAVKDYYHTTYPNSSERFAAFKEDKTAPTYLGEYYAATYDYFAQGN